MYIYIHIYIAVRSGAVYCGQYGPVFRRNCERCTLTMEAVVSSQRSAYIYSTPHVTIPEGSDVSTARHWNSRYNSTVGNFLSRLARQKAVKGRISGNSCLPTEIWHIKTYRITRTSHVT